MHQEDPSKKVQTTIKKSELNQWLRVAAEDGYDSISPWIRWVLRRYIKGEIK